MNEFNVMYTEPPSLLTAMLALIRRKGCQAAEVIGYRERSYNIGYCETCHDIVSETRIFYTRPDDSEAYYEAAYTGLAELIRDLTDDATEQRTWNATAIFESEDERADRFLVHGYDEEAED